MKEGFARMWKRRAQAQTTAVQEAIAMLVRLQQSEQDIEAKQDQQSQEQTQRTETLRIELDQLQADVRTVLEGQNRRIETLQEEFVRLQGTLRSIQETQEKQRKEIERLALSSDGLRFAVAGSEKWREVPSEAAFYDEEYSEAKEPFLIPFSPEVELMLWIERIPYITLPPTILILPRIYAHRELCRVDSTRSTPTPSILIISGEDTDEPDAYLALVLDATYAPTGLPEALEALKGQSDLNIRLIWYTDQTQEQEGQERTIRVALTYLLCPDPVATHPSDWSGKTVLFFHNRPIRELARPLPRIPVSALATQRDAAEPPQTTQESSEP